MLDIAVAHAQEYYLENGLKVVLIPQTAAPVASLMIVYRVGARNEAVGYTGSSHLLEHMLFKGTHANNRRNGRAFADIMNEIGANKNATTWLDRTNYFETVPSGFLDFAIELEADRMRNAFIADSDRRSEMTVVRNELERNDSNFMRVLNAALVGAAFREHPYHHPTIGWRSDVEGVSTERLRELYDTFYHPDNATAFVVGDFDLARTRDTIERCFGALPRAAVAIPDVYTNEPPQAGERSVVVKRPGDTAIVGFAYHTPAAFGQTTVLAQSELARIAATGTPLNDESDVLDVLARILGRGRTSRLARAFVDTGMALDASASNWGTRDPGLFQLFVNVRPGVSATLVRDEMSALVEKLIVEGPTPEEIERARTQIAVARAFGREGSHSLAQRLAELEAVGSWRLDDAYDERIAAVTPERVREVAEKYLHEDNRSVGLLVPGTAKTFDVVPFTVVEERPAADAAVEAAPLPEPRAAVRASFQGRIAGAELASGLRWKYVAAKETATVHVRGLFSAGPAYAIERPMLSSIVAGMLSRGTKSMGRLEIEARLERAGIRRAYHADDERSSTYDPLAFRFSAACVASDLEELLVTLAEELRDPAFDAAELELLKNEMMGGLRLARTNTGWRAAQRFSQLVYAPSDANYESDLDALIADIEATTVDDVRGFHASRVLAAAPIVSGAGGVDERAFAALLEETLGSVTFLRVAPPLPEVASLPPAERREDVPLERKANVDIVIGRATSLVRSSPDFHAASIANAVLGRSTLSSRLGLRLREREGLTYGITSSFLSASHLPGPWRVALGVNPANVERAVDLVREVLAELIERPPGERELTQQRNAMIGTHEVALATNSGIAGMLERMTDHDLPADHADTVRACLEAVTPQDVCEAAGRYLGPENLTVTASGTFAAS